MSETKTSFANIQSRIDSFSQKISSQEDIFFKENKLQLSDAIFCAEDSTRNKKFYDAIGQALQDIRSKIQDDQKIRVVDAGAGLGVLGIFALLHGADESIFIEENPVTCRICEDFVSELGLGKKSRFICEDASKVEGIGFVDMIISETVAIDFSEDYHAITAHLSKSLKPYGLIIPERFDISSTQEKLSGRCYLYKDIFIDSGECMSFFNERPI